MKLKQLVRQFKECRYVNDKSWQCHDCPYYEEDDCKEMLTEDVISVLNEFAEKENENESHI